MYGGMMSQSLLRQRLLPDIVDSKVAPLAQNRLNRFFVSDYFRTQEGPIYYLVHSRLNRFFVSDYFRTRPRGGYSHPACYVSIASSSAITSGRLRAPCHGQGSNTSQSLLRQRLLPDRGCTGLSGGVPVVSIASSSAITSGPCQAQPRRATPCLVSIASSSAITSGPVMEVVSVETVVGLNRFFVSDYFRTVQVVCPISVD